jgi:hypothetical protein
LTDAVAVYRALLLECERRRQQLGVSMERFSEFAGIPDRSYGKCLYPDSSAGRQATWETVQRIVDGLFPDGFDLIMKPRKGPGLDKYSVKFAARFGAAFHDRKHIREHMSELGKRGAAGYKSKVSKSRRSALARRAAMARWRFPKKVQQ